MFQRVLLTLALIVAVGHAQAAPGAPGDKQSNEGATKARAPRPAQARVDPVLAAFVRSLTPAQRQELLTLLLGQNAESAENPVQIGGRISISVLTTGLNYAILPDAGALAWLFPKGTCERITAGGAHPYPEWDGRSLNVTGQVPAKKRSFFHRTDTVALGHATPLQTVTLGSGGAFSFEPVPNGDYEIVVQVLDRDPYQSGIVLEWGPLDRVACRSVSGVPGGRVRLVGVPSADSGWTIF